MSFVLEYWYLFVVAIVSGVMLLVPTLGRQGGTSGVTTGEAVRMINREKAVLVDVSEPAEYAAGHAQGARSIPLGGLDGAKNLPSNKTLPILLMCATGGRAGKAAGMLRKAGYEKVHTVAGGLKAWREANLPVEKTS